MNKLAVTDNRTGEILQLEYDAINRKYTINGTDATRQQPLEASDNEYIFSAMGTGTQRLYHVLVDDVKKLWKPKN
jgi:hypothetical protein